MLLTAVSGVLITTKRPVRLWKQMYRHIGNASVICQAFKAAFSALVDGTTFKPNVRHAFETVVYPENCLI